MRGGICNSKPTDFPDNCNRMRVRRGHQGVIRIGVLLGSTWSGSRWTFLQRRQKVSLLFAQEFDSTALYEIVIN
jgi:hypothetical protein